ncbi:MAG: Eco57I restriction-modification methylase domain-containing protein, partial [Bacteroidota bacterium]|nr:Eco57I restriction-modification methylase domain-containing protein [Bacteroidota bacterium]
ANDEDILKYAYYDYVISNPPYYKITKYDQKLKDVLPQLSEQPNIYFLFLYESALRLKEGGEMVFLIPRSFFSGGFFKQFRDILLNIVSFETIHLFQDNKELFEDSGVLSEFVIIKAVKNSLLEEHLLKITCSSREEEDINFDYSYILDRKSNIIMLPKSEDDVKIIEKVNSFGSSLRKFNLEIKQGNILNSRMEKFILPANSTFETAAPYITCATLSDGKANRTLVCHETEKLLIPNKNYILFLRYNTKRAYKGITAVPYYQQKHDSKNIFIDKQLNYIDKIGGGLNEREVDAIVEILNSEIIQKYIKIINGEMNVSTEMLYDIPLPQDIL